MRLLVFVCVLSLELQAPKIPGGAFNKSFQTQFVPRKAKVQWKKVRLRL